jgi:hypothetical protein
VETRSNDTEPTTTTVRIEIIKVNLIFSFKNYSLKTEFLFTYAYNIGIIVQMITTITLRPICLIFAFAQALAWTACFELPLDNKSAPQATIAVKNIPDTIKITPEAKTILDKGNAMVHYRQVGTDIHVETKSLYLLAMFVPVDPPSVIVQALEIINTADYIELMDLSAAFSLKVIDGSTLTHPLFELAPDMGAYWDSGNSAGNYRVITILLTPDVRYLLEAKAAYTEYVSGNPTYELDYNSDQLVTRYSVAPAIPAATLTPTFTGADGLLVADLITGIKTIEEFLEQASPAARAYGISYALKKMETGGNADPIPLVDDNIFETIAGRF